MHPIARTPSILVTLGRCSRLFNLYLTTAPRSLDAPSTITLHAAPLVNIAVLADVSLPLDAVDGQLASRLVLVDSVELDWQRKQLRAGGYRLIGADPFLFGPDSLEKWLWRRLQATAPDTFGNGAERRSESV